MRRQPRSLGQALAVAVVNAVTVTAGLVAGFSLMPGSMTFEEDDRLKIERVEDPVPGIIERHGCWTGEAPPDVVAPGHVVVTLEDGRVQYGGRRVTGRALEQVFDGADHGLIVHAFCR